MFCTELEVDDKNLRTLQFGPQIMGGWFEAERPDEEGAIYRLEKLRICATTTLSLRLRRVAIGGSPNLLEHLHPICLPQDEWVEPVLRVRPVIIAPNNLQIQVVDHIGNPVDNRGIFLAEAVVLLLRS